MALLNHSDLTTGRQTRGGVSQLEVLIRKLSSVDGLSSLHQHPPVDHTTWLMSTHGAVPVGKVSTLHTANGYNILRMQRTCSMKLGMILWKVEP